MPHQSDFPAARRRRAFTLLELMVSMSVLSLIMLLVFQMLSHTQRIWSSSRARLSTFKEARVAFESITRRIGQATLNSYWDYEMSGSGATATPKSYKKESDMQFVCGKAETLLSRGGSKPGHAVFFQAPIGFSVDANNQGLQSLLNAWGFYVELATDEKFIPDFLRSAGVVPKKRYRLMEFRPPSENLALYATNMNSGSGAALYGWFANYYDEPKNSDANGIYFSRPLAENILVLVIEPRESKGVGTTTSLAPNYRYDSRELNGTGTPVRHALPPLVDVTMVAIDENSAIRYQQINGSLDGLVPTGMFSSAAAYESDIAQLRVKLDAARIDYRVFQETVIIRASKWGTDEEIPTAP